MAAKITLAYQKIGISIVTVFDATGTLVGSIWIVLNVVYELIFVFQRAIVKAIVIKNKQGT